MLSKIISGDCQSVVSSVGSDLEKLRGKNVLVTGAAGMLGSYFVDTLAHMNSLDGEKVIVTGMDNFRGGIPDRFSHLKGEESFTFKTFDVREPLPEGSEFDFIIHAAGIASPVAYRKYPIDTMDVNVVATRNFLEYARKREVESFLFFSSSEIYGDPDLANIPTPETYRGLVSSTGPRSCYDESKRYGETLCTYFHQVYGVKSKIVRPFNVYGPGLRKDDGRIIPDLIARAVESRPLVLYSTGRDTRSFCYVSDAIDGFFRVLLSDFSGEPFNVGSSVAETTMLEAAKQVSAIAGNLPVELEVSKEANYLTDNPKRRCPDLAKIKSKLGYEPKVPLPEGLARMLEWAKVAWA